MRKKSGIKNQQRYFKIELLKAMMDDAEGEIGVLLIYLMGNNV